MERAERGGTKNYTVPIFDEDLEVIKDLCRAWDATRAKVMQALISEAIRARREAGTWEAPSDG